MSRNAQTTEHPDWVDLDMVRTGEADDDVRRHVAGCAECAQRLEFLEGTGTALAVGKEEPSIRPQTDAAVMQMIDSRVDRIRRPVLQLRSVIWAAAAIIVVGLAVWFAAVPPWGGTRDAVVVNEGPREDVNGDGAVDILDAFLVAERLQAGPRAPLKWDMNSDGRVDQADVDWLAAKAVSLEEGS